MKKPHSAYLREREFFKISVSHCCYRNITPCCDDDDDDMLTYSVWDISYSRDKLNEFKFSRDS